MPFGPNNAPRVLKRANGAVRPLVGALRGKDLTGGCGAKNEPQQPRTLYIPCYLLVHTPTGSHVGVSVKSKNQKKVL